jgi:hypothetical protein
MIAIHNRDIQSIENIDGTFTVIVLDGDVESLRVTATTEAQALATVNAHAPHIEPVIEVLLPEPQEPAQPILPKHIAEIL